MWSVVARCLEDWSGLQRKEGRKERREQRLKSEECLSAGCLGASVCYISCSHFEFFKWLLGPAHSHTHTHTSTEYLTDTQREGLTDLHRAIKGMLTFNLVAVDLCRRIFVRGRSRPLLRLPSQSPPCTRLVLACQLRNLFVTHFCSALFYVSFFIFIFWFAFFAVVCFSCFLCFLGSGFSI